MSRRPVIENCDCPVLEDWSVLKSFAMGMMDVPKYATIGGMIAGWNNVSDPAILDYYRGRVHGMWINGFTAREKRIILMKYTILRLER